VKRPQFAEIEACYIAEEDLADKPATLEEHEARLRALQPAPPPKAPTEPEVDRERAKLEAMKKQINKVLVDSKVDPKVIAELDKTNDPRAMFDILQRATQEKLRELEAMTAAMKGG
jgi:hypothetical protein